MVGRPVQQPKKILSGRHVSVSTSRSPKATKQQQQSLQTELPLNDGTRSDNNGYSPNSESSSKQAPLYRRSSQCDYRDENCEFLDLETNNDDDNQTMEAAVVCPSIEEEEEVPTLTTYDMPYPEKLTEMRLRHQNNCLQSQSQLAQHSLLPSSWEQPSIVIILVVGSVGRRKKELLALKGLACRQTPRPSGNPTWRNGKRPEKLQQQQRR